MKPMKNPLGVSPSKGNQGTTRCDLLEVVGSIPTEVVWFPDFPSIGFI